MQWNTKCPPSGGGIPTYRYIYICRYSKYCQSPRGSLPLSLVNQQQQQHHHIQVHNLPLPSSPSPSPPTGQQPDSIQLPTHLHPYLPTYLPAYLPTYSKRSPPKNATPTLSLPTVVLLLSPHIAVAACGRARRAETCARSSMPSQLPGDTSTLILHP